jgi:hypothetical protein
LVNRVRGERALELEDGRYYVLLFTNSAFCEVDAALPDGGLEAALRGSAIHAMEPLLWAATRHYHRRDLPTPGSLHVLIDDVADEFYETLSLLVDAYRAAQPDPEDSAGDPAEYEQEDLPLEGHPEDNGNASPKPVFTWEGYWRNAMNTGLTPDQFWSMTPRETSAWIEGYHYRIDDTREYLSPFVATLANVHIRKRHQKINPKDLVDREKERIERMRRKEQAKDPQSQLKLRAEQARMLKEIAPPPRPRPRKERPTVPEDFEPKGIKKEDPTKPPAGTYKEGGE